jgi:hypothetical protein
MREVGSEPQDVISVLSVMQSQGPIYTTSLSVLSNRISHSLGTFPEFLAGASRKLEMFKFYTCRSV